MVEAYFEFARDRRTAMLFIHASAYASFLPAHATLVAEIKSASFRRILSFFAGHSEAGRVVAMPLELLEVLVIGPVAELTRRWLADDAVDLREAARVLPARIFASITRGST